MRDSAQCSFFGSTELAEVDQGLYDRLIAPDYFLRQLDALVDWRFVHRLCRGCYARGVGRPAASPVMFF